jgi:hypothetical protein
MASRISDTALKQAILFFGTVSFFLGKKALEGEDAPPKRDPSPHDDPVIKSLRAATRPGA